MGIGKGVKEGAAYLSGKANVTDFLTKEGIPPEQAADTFKAIEKAQDKTLQLPALNQEDRSGVVASSGPGELEAVENPTETSVNQQVEKADPGSKQSGSPYRQLEMALEAAGEPKPADHAGHHMVSVFDRRAEPARQILQEFDIPLSSYDNGVWLPRTREAGPGAYHPGLNTREYHAEVYRRLQDATNKEEVLGVLRDIKEELSENRFPY
ncbi:MAG: AHH domain-containing protein [Syntrophobacteraceae bacterium]